MFAVIPTLLNADNLQRVVSASADNDFDTLKQKITQLASLLSELQKHLADWQHDPINRRPIDRNSIISELVTKSCSIF